MDSIKQISDVVTNIIKSESSFNNIAANIETGVRLAANDPLAILSVLCKSIEYGGSITNILFYNKLKEFLTYINKIPLEDRVNFVAKYINGKEDEFSKRLVEEIDCIDDSNKMYFLSNTFRALVYDKINLNYFYRIIRIIRNLLYQDLMFLKDNIQRKELEPTIEVTALNNLGLMYMSGIGNSTEQNKYDFVELADIVVNYAILGKEESNKCINEEKRMQITQVPPPKWETEF